MRPQWYWSVVAGLSLFSVSDQVYSQDAATATNRLKIVELSGSAYQRGRTHGEQLRNDIQSLVRLWKADLQRNYGAEADKFIAEFLNATDFRSAIRKWAPDLLEEVRGIAEGAELPFETIFCFQLADEVWVNGREIGQGISKERCSVFGVAGNGNNPAIIAQNLDLEGFRNGFQTVLHIKGQGLPEQYILTFAGYLGGNGVSDCSIGIGSNAMFELRHARNGLPVAFIIRKVLEQTNAAEALAILKKVPHATGQNYILGAGDDVYDFECSPRKIVRFKPTPDGKLVYHTNHRIVNDDIDDVFTALLRKVDPEAKALQNTRTRLETLKRRLKGKKALDIDSAAAILRSHDSEDYPVCVPLRGPAAAFTFGSAIMQLSGQPEFHVSAGPPDVYPYQVFRFRR